MESARMLPASAGARRAAGRLTRERVVDAAYTIIDSGEYAQLSMRRLARDLGVAPMTLYGYVRDRDDLLDAVVDRLMASVWRPTLIAGTAREWMVDSCRRFYELLVDEPAALHIYLARPVTSPAAKDRLAAFLDHLDAAGITPEASMGAYATIHTYTIGFAALAASRRRFHELNTDPAAESLRAFVSIDQYLKGLAVILDGLGI
ncbi:MAG TPA: TetR/AcrR family transcriptional regulator [Acidimicrobiales bacterium]|nr:TetR/AcrR family transcriptional regulator [Acidimicrobiales bacterium]